MLVFVIFCVFLVLNVLGEVNCKITSIKGNDHTYGKEEGLRRQRMTKKQTTIFYEFAII